MQPNTTKFVDLDGYFNQLMFSWYYVMGLCIEKYASTFESEREIQQAQINETIADLNKRLEEYDSLIIDTKIEIQNNLLNLTIPPENFKGYCIFIFQSLKQNFTYLRDVHWAITIKLKERNLYHLLNADNKQELVLIKDRNGFDFHESEIGSRLDDFYVKACEAFEGYDFYPIVKENVKFSRSSNYLSDEFKENSVVHNTSQTEKTNQPHLVNDEVVLNAIEKRQSNVKPIQLDMEQRQIIYLFQKLIDEKLLNENKNPTIWDLVAKYFTDKDNKPLSNIHQNKDGLKNTKTGKPKKNADTIERIVTNTKANK